MLYLLGSSLDCIDLYMYLLGFLGFLIGIQDNSINTSYGIQIKKSTSKLETSKK